MAIFNGWIALGTAYNSSTSTLTELSGGGYARLAVSLVGNFVTGANQTMSAFGIPAATATPLPIKNGSIFDAATGGNMLCHWSWGLPPYTLNTAAFPATTINIMILTGIGAMANVSTMSIAAGSQIGSVNGNALVAARLLILNNAVFVAQGSPQAPYIASGVLPTQANVPTTGSGVVYSNSGILTIA
jgi:hypothetical protein